MKNEKRPYIITQGVFLAMAIVFITIFIVDNLTVDRATQLPHTSFLLADWTWIKSDGTRQPVRLPTELDVEKGETVILETHVPYVIREGYWMMFFNSRDVKVYVGDEMRYSFDRDQVRIAGGIVKGIWSFTRLSEADNGKVIRIVRDSTETFNGTFKELYYGDGLGVCYEYVKANGLFYLFAILLIVLAIFIILAGTVMHLAAGHKIPLVKLGIGMLCAALWLIFDSEVYQLIFDNYYIDGLMQYMVPTLMPLPVLSYVNDMQKKRHEKIHIFLMTLSLVSAVCMFILHFAGIRNYEDNSTVIFIVYGLLTIGVGYTIIIDTKERRFNQYRIIAYGTVGFLITALAEIIMLLAVDDRNDGVMLLAGFYILLGTGLVQQVQESIEADRARRQAQEASKQKSTFLANMSHEIRTPINSIIGMNEMILRENENPEIREYARQVESSGKMLLGLINDILDFSKIEAGKMEIVPVPYDTVTFINDIEVMMEERATSHGLDTVYNIAEDIPTELIGDDVHLKQVVVNLVSNAVKYTNEGSVTLSITTSPAIAENAVDLTVAVKDTGMGIRKENLDTLFDTFTRVDEQRNRSIEGTGLGLSIVKNLVESMEGSITVESEYGIGSTFTVVLTQRISNPKPIGKLGDALERNKNKTYDYTEKFHAPKAQILAVDDNAVNLKVVKELLKSTKVNIDTASGGRECIKKCRDKHYDLILMDHRMPDPDGVETLHLLRGDSDGLNCETPAVVLTANAFAGLKEKYIAEGFIDYLSKPIDSKLLEEKVMMYLPQCLLEKKEEASPEKVQTLLFADRMREIAEIDYDGTMNKYGGSEEFMRTLLKTVVSEGRKKAKQMHTHLNQNNSRLLSLDLRAIRNSLTTIGATKLSDKAKNLEFTAKESKMEYVDTHIASFNTEFGALLDTIEKAFEE